MGYEAADSEYRYSSTLSLPLVLEECGWLRHAPAALYPAKEARDPLQTRLGGSLVPVLAGVENRVPRPGIQSPDRPSRSESLYGLSYRGPPRSAGRLKSHAKNCDAEDTNIQIRNFCNSSNPVGASNNECPAFYGHDRVPNLSQSNPPHTFMPQFFNLLKLRDAPPV